VASASSSFSTSSISSSSLSIAAGSANGRIPCRWSGASSVSTLPLSAAEPVETLLVGGGLAPAAYRAFFLADGAGEELGRGASSAAAVTPEGRRRARIGFGGEFCLPRGTGGVFPTWRGVPALPIGTCCIGPVRERRLIIWDPTRIGTKLGSLVVHQFLPRAQKQRRPAVGRYCGSACGDALRASQVDQMDSSHPNTSTRI
jgi:hypothetical protein